MAPEVPGASGPPSGTHDFVSNEEVDFPLPEFDAGPALEAGSGSVQHRTRERAAATPNVRTRPIEHSDRERSVAVRGVSSQGNDASRIFDFVRPDIPERNAPVPIAPSAASSAGKAGGKAFGEDPAIRGPLDTGNRDVSKLAAALQQLREALLEQGRNFLSKQDFQRENAALRRLIESKGK